MVWQVVPKDNPGTPRCDRCHKEISDTQMYPPVQIGFQFEPRQLCRKCIDEYKEVMITFWSKYSTREKVGDSDMYKYALPKGYPYTAKELVDSIPNILPPVISTKYEYPKKEEPKHEGRKPTNIFSKLFYMMFFEKVEPE
jgi:hypothetical protein